MEYGCQQVLVEDKGLIPILEYLCQQSNKVYNCALYYARQVYFKTKRLVSYSLLIRVQLSKRERNAESFFGFTAKSCSSLSGTPGSRTVYGDKRTVHRWAQQYQQTQDLTPRKVGTKRVGILEQHR